MEIQDALLQMGKYSCLALCYIKAALLKKGDTDDKKCLHELIDIYYDTNYLMSDCTVLCPSRIISKISGYNNITVHKANEPTNRGYEVFGYSKDAINYHWVLAKDGKIIFNSLQKSRNVLEGKLMAVRIVRFNDGNE